MAGNAAAFTSSDRAVTPGRMPYTVRQSSALEIRSAKPQGLPSKALPTDRLDTFQSIAAPSHSGSLTTWACLTRALVAHEDTRSSPSYSRNCASTKACSTPDLEPKPWRHKL